MRSAGSKALRAVPGAIYLGSATTTSTGSVAAAFGIADGMRIGDYVLQVNGLTRSSTVRSVNVLMVVFAPVTSKAGMVRQAAFYLGGSDKLSTGGRAKLRSMVAAVPKGAQNVRVTVVGVSTALGTARANLDLARDRAQGIVDYLEARGVDGTYTVSISTTFDVDTAGTRDTSTSIDAALSVDAPLTSSAGKPLTTTTIAFTSPALTSSSSGRDRETR